MKTSLGSLLLGTLFLLTSCAHVSNSIDWASDDSYLLDAVDNPDNNRFDVILRSLGEQKLCLAVQQWPSRSGQLHMGSSFAHLEVGNRRLPATDENFGYCPGGCGTIEIPPHGELKGFIAYAAFGDPEAIKREPQRRLDYSIKPIFCK